MKSIIGSKLSSFGSKLNINGVFHQRRHKRTSSLPENSTASAVFKISSCKSVASADAAFAGGALRICNEEAGPSEANSSSSKLQRYNSQLGLAEHEKVIKVFPCFLVSDLLVQGCLIVTEGHVCFCSSLFGLKKSKKIKFEDIVRITKVKVYALFPTGIAVRTTEEKVTFSTATSRDKLVQLLRKQRSKFPNVEEVDTKVDKDADEEEEAEADSTEVSIGAAPNVNEDSFVPQQQLDKDSTAYGGEIRLRSSNSQQQQWSRSTTASAEPRRHRGRNSDDNDAGVCPADFHKEPVPVSTSPIRRKVLQPTDRPSKSGNSDDRGPASDSSISSLVALSIMAVVLATCILFAAHLTHRLGAMQHQLTTMSTVAKQQQAIGAKPGQKFATHSSSSSGSKRYRHLNDEVGDLIIQLSLLEDKLLRMRQQVLETTDRRQTLASSRVESISVTD